MKTNDIVLTPDLETAQIVEIVDEHDAVPTLAKIQLLGTDVFLYMPCDELEPMTRFLYEDVRKEFKRKLKAMEQGVDIIRSRPQS